MKTRLVLLAFFSLGMAAAQTLMFAPQVALSQGVTLWAVTGCPAKPVPISRVYQIATEHGLTYLTPGSAAVQVNRQSVWSRIVKYGGFAAAGASALLSWKVIEAKLQWQQAMQGAGGFLNILLPLVKQQVPVLDSAVGSALLVDTTGCGQTMFYATSAGKGAFVEPAFAAALPADPADPQDPPKAVKPAAMVRSARLKRTRAYWEITLPADIRTLAAPYQPQRPVTAAAWDAAAVCCGRP